MDIAQDGNLFPREDLLEAVAQSDWREQPVPLVAWFLAALGLGLLALGRPILAPLAVEPTTWSAELALDGGWRALLAHPLHGVIGSLGPSLGGMEFLWFLGSSVALAMGFLGLGAVLRAAGIGQRLAFFTALCSILAPVALAHGRLPSDFVWGIAGASILAALVSAPSDGTPGGSRGYGRRVALGLMAACSLHPLNVAAAPGAWLAAYGRGGLGALAPAVLAVAAFELLSPHGSASGAGALFHPALDLVLAGGSLWLILPRAWVREREESPPPRWLSAWLLGAIALSVGSAFRGGAPSPAIVPAIALLAAGSLARYARPDNAFRWAASLLAGQIALIAAGAFWLHALSLHQGVSGLSRATPELFEPGDVLWVSQEEEGGAAAYLVRRRFGVPVLVEGRGDDQIHAGRHLTLLGRGPAESWRLDAEQGTVAPRE